MFRMFPGIQELLFLEDRDLLQLIVNTSVYIYHMVHLHLMMIDPYIVYVYVY